MRKHWEQAVRETDAEKDELIQLSLKMRKAAEEPTLSGRLRKAAPKSPLTFDEIVERLGISWEEYSDFLAGDHPLPSDVLDRLAELLGYELVAARSESRPV